MKDYDHDHHDDDDGDDDEDNSAELEITVIGDEMGGHDWRTGSPSSFCLVLSAFVLPFPRPSRAPSLLVARVILVFHPTFLTPIHSFILYIHSFIHSVPPFGRSLLNPFPFSLLSSSLSLSLTALDLLYNPPLL